MKKTAVFYYSFSGNTEKLAAFAAKALNADLISIYKEPYDSDGKPEIVQSLKRLAGGFGAPESTDYNAAAPYDIILLGYPVWFSKLPPIVDAFVRSTNLEGKTVIPFSTFNKTGTAWTMKQLKQTARGAKVMLPFDYGSTKHDNFDIWIKNIRAI